MRKAAAEKNRAMKIVKVGDIVAWCRHSREVAVFGRTERTTMN